MGKSPGKWIKGLFGKKTSKSEISKGRVLSKSASERPARNSSKEPIANVLPDQPQISGPVSGTITEERNNSEFETLKGINEEKAVRDAELVKVPDPCLEKNELDQAALTLQAFIRGHLVRRQAVATLYCVQGIVRFQALARGQMVRKHNSGTVQFRGKSSVAKVAKSSDTSEITMNVQACGLLKNAFIYKLCGSSSSPSVMPLRLNYDQGEPNSAWNWLIRWSKLQIWAFDSKPKQTCEPKHEITEIESSKNVTDEHGEQNLVLSTEKASTLSSEFPEENALCENDKVKHDKQHLAKPTHEISTEAELDVESPLKDLSEVSKSSTTSKLLEEKSDVVVDLKPMEGTQKPASENDDDVKSGGLERISGKNTISHLSSEQPLVDLIGDKSNDNLTGSNKESKLEQSSIVSHKSSRRASLPAKHMDQDMTTPAKVPSYMATTASSKAKAKAQVSPRLGLDRNSLDRRLSLPSSVTVRMSSSPRAQKPVQGKGVKIDRSLSSSRDVSAKVIQADWKR